METITDKSFKKVLNSKKPALVIFWSDECMACELARKDVFELMKVYHESGQVEFFKFDMSNGGVTPQVYGLQSIPSFAMFKNSELVGTVTGRVHIFTLEKLIRSAL